MLYIYIYYIYIYVCMYIITVTTKKYLGQQGSCQSSWSPRPANPKAKSPYLWSVGCLDEDHSSPIEP